MLQKSLTTILFVAGFCATVPAAPWVLWQHGPQTEASLMLLLVSLPFYVWVSGYAYLRAFDATEAATAHLYVWALNYLAERPKAGDKVWILQLQPTKIRVRR
jgi:hypothetical protein